MPGSGVVFEPDDDAFGHRAAAGIFEGRFDTYRDLSQLLAEKFRPALTENCFRRPIDQGKAKLGVEANISFLYGIEDYGSLVNLPDSKSTDFRGGLLRCRRISTTRWRQK